MNLKSAFLAAAAVVLLPVSAFAQTNFPVTVTFDPAGPTTTASLSCNGGVPLDQSKAGLGDAQGVTFVVAGVDATTDCTASGAPVGGYSLTATGCVWTDIGDTTPGACTLDYVANDVTFTVFKDWVLDGPGAADIQPSYEITVHCNAEITDDSGAELCWDSEGHYYCEFELEGTVDRTVSVDVDVTSGSATCSAEEDIDESSVSSSSTCGSIAVGVGSNGSCTITNTVFYEGIPTLSQYGLAVLALLMLGVGFVGFRRFV